jgi:hypothetical protein
MANMPNTETIAITLQKICNGFPLILKTLASGTVYSGARQIGVTPSPIVSFGLGAVSRVSAQPGETVSHRSFHVPAKTSNAGIGARRSPRPCSGFAHKIHKFAVFLCNR